MPLAIAVVAALLLLAWGGVEVNEVLHRYPGQFLMGAVTFVIIAFALAAARFRLASQRVPLRPAAPPLPPAVKAAPVRVAVAAPGAQDAGDCEGPDCPGKVDDDPWTARVENGTSHVFCSQECAQAWTDRQAAQSHPVP
jgi:hypothetical protein